MIYLDFNRTTPLAPSVLGAMHPDWATHFMLPGQEHAHAQVVGEALEQARESVAGMVGCDPFEIVFTGGGTAANNWAIRGQLTPPPRRRPTAGGPTASEGGHVLVSELEHD
ncbi:MAG: aminotransferase class V-fold PLP-dependent enzyme, partial [Novipirellula sp. JB048]